MKIRKSIVLFNKDLSNSFQSIKIISELENDVRVKENEFRSNITNIKEFLFQNDYDTSKIFEFITHNYSIDPSEIFENGDFLDEKIQELFEEDNNYSLKDQVKEDEYENKEKEMEDHENEKIEALNDFNEFLEQNEEFISNPNEESKISFKREEETKVNNDLKSNKKYSDIDKDIMKYMKKKKSDDLKFTNINDNLNHNSADVFYRILSLAQREKIEIVQNEINEIDQIFIKLF